MDGVSHGRCAKSGMYSRGGIAQGRLDSLDPDNFGYLMTAEEPTA